MITKSSEKKQTSGKVVAMPVSGGSTLNVLYPESFDEARNICQFLRLNQAVIVNLENMKRDNATQHANATCQNNTPVIGYPPSTAIFIAFWDV